LVEHAPDSYAPPVAAQAAPRKRLITNRAVVVIGLVLAMAMAALEATVVSTAMPSVVGDLHGIQLYAWVTTAYLLTASVTVPLYGKLADMYGRKPILLFGIAVFLIGSAASGAASSMGQLIAFRALQGLGAGAMQPIALTVVGDIFDLEERSRIQGVFGAAWGLFGMTGPALGGFLVKHLSWRWVFYVNLPFGVIAAAILIFALHEGIEKRPRQVDFAGAGLLVLGLSALLLATSRSAHGVAVWAGPLAVVFLGAFVLVERRAAEPVLPLALFARRVILTASVSGSVIGGAMMAASAFIPLFVQGVLRGEPTEAGIAVTPMLIGWPIASTLGGRLIPRFGFRPFVRVGLFITFAAALGLAIYGERGGIRGLQIISALFGVGMGFANTALLIAVQTSVSWGERGIATASTMFFRTIGGALAVSAMGGVLNAALAKSPSVSEELASRVLSPEGVRGLPPALIDEVSGAIALGVGWIFWIIVGIAAVAFVTCLWFPEIRKAHGDEVPEALTGH
jgi:EmrB/QacA subfamily drug resistance transporter